MLIYVSNKYITTVLDSGAAWLIFAIYVTETNMENNICFSPLHE